MAISMNNHVFKGHKTLLGSKFVTYGEIELPTRYDIFPKSSAGFDWGNGGTSSIQLAFSMLYQLTNKELAQEYAIFFTNEVVKNLNSRDWMLSANDVLKWIEKNCASKLLEDEKQNTTTPIPPVKKLQPKATRKSKKNRSNVVKNICKELGITQKQLAEILEVPEGTVSSWAVKDEIPRLGKKAIEFYQLNVKNQKIVDSYRNFQELLQKQ
jgi:DNA-binding transcriptional regulator YiaG